MQILNYIKKKYIRLQGSRNVLKLNYFIEKNFRDKKLGNIGFDFSNKPSRQAIVQKIIDYKNYNQNIIIGKNSIKPRLTKVPTIIPLPKKRHYVSIYELQKSK